jgi:transcriptional regulator with XRE-family HTH domain
MDFSTRLRAIELRKNGLSYSEIRKSVNVSKSTLSNWLKDIELTNEQKKRLSKLQATGYIGAKTLQTISSERHREIREMAKREVSNLLDNSLFIAGLMLYWAEGDKRSGRVQFSNSDSEMIKLMMRWFREFCKVPEDKFRIGLFVHSLHVREDYLNFWSRITGLSISQFNRPYIKPTIFSNRKNKLYEGTCVIKIHSKDLLSRILGWLDGVKNSLMAEDI